MACFPPPKCHRVRIGSYAFFIFTYVLGVMSVAHANPHAAAGYGFTGAILAVNLWMLVSTGYKSLKQQAEERGLASFDEEGNLVPSSSVTCVRRRSGGATIKVKEEAAATTTPEEAVVVVVASGATAAAENASSIHIPPAPACLGAGGDEEEEVVAEEMRCESLEADLARLPDENPWRRSASRTMTGAIFASGVSLLISSVYLYLAIAHGQVYNMESYWMGWMAYLMALKWCVLAYYRARGWREEKVAFFAAMRLGGIARDSP